MQVDELNVTVMGPASVIYSGDPKVSKTVHGPGSWNDALPKEHEAEVGRAQEAEETAGRTTKDQPNRKAQSTKFKGRSKIFSVDISRNI